MRATNPRRLSSIAAPRPDVKAPRAQAVAVVVFAHVPPPFHGQSYMVQLLLEGLRVQSVGELPLQIVHIDARYSSSTGDIGSAGLRKVFRAIRYSICAIRAHFQTGACVLYYVPAPARSAALYRDWIVMALCRPFFNRIVLHWHAVGLGERTRSHARSLERKLTLLLLGHAHLSIVLSEFARDDAEVLLPRQIVIVPNGLPDPCPDFEAIVRPKQQRRRTARQDGKAAALAGELPSFTVLFLASCSAAKGLFVAVEAVALLKKQLARDAPQMQLQLKVAGEFLSLLDRQQFEQRIAADDLNGNAQASPVVEHVGFVDTATKARLFETVDCLCLPSVYPHEGQPVSIIEALAYDLPVVATRWRGIPEMLDGTVSFLLDGQDPPTIAQAFVQTMAVEPSGANRARFLERFQVDRYTENIATALRSVT